MSRGGFIINEDISKPAPSILSKITDGYIFCRDGDLSRLSNRHNVFDRLLLLTCDFRHIFCSRDIFGKLRIGRLSYATPKKL